MAIGDAVSQIMQSIHEGEQYYDGDEWIDILSAVIDELTKERDALINGEEID